MFASIVSLVSDRAIVCCLVSAVVAFLAGWCASARIADTSRFQSNEVKLFGLCVMLYSGLFCLIATMHGAVLIAVGFAFCCLFATGYLSKSGVFHA